MVLRYHINNDTRQAMIAKLTDAGVEDTSHIDTSFDTLLRAMDVIGDHELRLDLIREISEGERKDMFTLQTMVRNGLDAGNEKIGFKYVEILNIKELKEDFSSLAIFDCDSILEDKASDVTSTYADIEYDTEFTVVNDHKELEYITEGIDKEDSSGIESFADGLYSAAKEIRAMEDCVEDLNRTFGDWTLDLDTVEYIDTDATFEVSTAIRNDKDGDKFLYVVLHA